jgi:hypothetical protein
MRGLLKANHTLNYTGNNSSCLIIGIDVQVCGDSLRRSFNLQEFWARSQKLFKETVRFE